MAWDAEQLHNANLIRAIVKQRGLPDSVATIAIMTALAESGLHTDPGGAAVDHDSRGLFQQRPSAGWGTVQQVLDPAYATNRFLDSLQTKDWQHMQPWQAAQAVQISAYSDGSNYRAHYNEAQGLMGQKATPVDTTAYAGSAGYEQSAGSGGASTKSPTTAADLTSQSGLGAYLQVFNSIPELKQLMAAAVNSGMSANDFANSIYHSKWWSTHGDGYRKDYAQRVADPASWSDEYKAKSGTVRALAAQMGVTLSAQELDHLAKQSKIDGWDQQTAKNAIGQLWRNRSINSTTQSGEAASTQAQIKQYAADYGMTLSQAMLNNWTWRILSGAGNLDGVKAFAENYAKSAYPGLKQQLDSGLTVSDIAQPYKQSMSQILEVNPTSLTTTDPLIRKALQGKPDAKGVRTSTSISDFEDSLRSDPRWLNTDNSKQTFASALAHIGNDWGYGY
jgi:hypothetical protein